jgi:hypothetical protein
MFYHTWKTTSFMQLFTLSTGQLYLLSFLYNNRLASAGHEYAVWQTLKTIHIYFKFDPFFFFVSQFNCLSIELISGELKLSQN